MATQFLKAGCRLILVIARKHHAAIGSAAEIDLAARNDPQQISEPVSGHSHMWKRWGRWAAKWG